MNYIRTAVLTALTTTLLAAPSFGETKAPETEEQKTLYAVGMVVGKQLKVFSLSASELEWIKQGIDDTVKGGKTAVDVAAYNEKVQELARSRRKAQGEKQAAAGREFLEKAAKEKGAVKTASGMVFIPVSEGKGDPPKAADKVKVNYRGTLIDGTEFDSSYKRNKPLEVPLGNVVKCWTEGLQLIKPGGKARLVCPASLAYGETGKGDILPGATLQFEVELLEVLK